MNDQGRWRPIFEFLTSSMEVKMEVTQKIKIYVMWDVFSLVKRAKKSKSNFRLNVPGLWRSVSQFMTSLLEVKMEVTKKTTICIV